MAEQYIVYKYVLNNNHDREFQELINNNNFSLSNKVLLSDKEMILTWIYNYIVTFGKIKCFSIFKERELVHYSFFSSYCYKFGFLNKRDYIVGPCWTASKFRGMRIYPKTINKIAFEIVNKYIDAQVYLLIRPQNQESTKAINSTNGWIPVGNIKKTKMKNYRKCDWF